MSIHLARAQLLMQQHRYPLAEEQLRLALSGGTDTAIAHGLLSLCLLEQEKYDAATLEAQQAIHEAPNEPLGFYALANVQYKMRRLNEAHATIIEAIRIAPSSSQNFATLSGIEVARYRWPQALEAAEQGLACDPDDITCNNLRAIALVNLGRKVEAGQSIEATLAKNPEDAVTHANQGWALLHQQQPHEAMKHFREALRLDPNIEWARLGIVEAMKARFFVYRWLLTLFLWMQKFPPRIQFALMIGLVFGQSLLGTVLKAVPFLEPLSLPIAIAYVLFVWMTWTASSLFNLVLRLDSFGRLVLNSEERLESTLVGVCLILCLVCGSSAVMFDRNLATIPWRAALLYLGLMLPLIATFRKPPELRRYFAAYTAGVGFCIVMTTVYSFLLCVQLNALVGDNVTMEQTEQLKSMAMTMSQWLQYSIWGIAISTWLSAGVSVTPLNR